MAFNITFSSVQEMPDEYRFISTWDNKVEEVPQKGDIVVINLDGKNVSYHVVKRIYWKEKKEWEVYLDNNIRRH